MNEEEKDKLFSNIESDLWELKHNVAYINKKDYYGLSRDLLDYIRKIEKENKQLQNNWNELKKWLEEQKEFIKDIPTFSNDIKNNHIGMAGAYNNSLDKMQELEQGKDD